MSKVVSTREIIERLQEYEEEHGIGVVTDISTICNGDKITEYILEIANNSIHNKVFNNKDNRYKKTKIEILSVDDNIFFNSINHEYTFKSEFMDDYETFLSILVYDNNSNKYEVWINMSEAPETMYYMNGNKPKDKNFEDILLKYLEKNYPDYFLPAILTYRLSDDT